MLDKISNFYNRSMRSFFQNKNIEKYSANNEVKSVVPERFIRNLKNTIYKYMASVSNNEYIDKIRRYS